MFSAPSTSVVAGIQSLLVALVLLAFGYLLAGAVLGRRRNDVTLRAGLAFPALCGYVLALSLVHIVTGGGLFSSPWLVRSITVVVAVAAGARLLRREPHDETSSPREIALLVGLVALGALVWGTPVFRSLPAFKTVPIDFGNDVKLHLGWAMQMLNGESTPSNALTGEIPNYYPWFFHGLLSFIANVTPGGRAVHGLGPLQFVQVAGATMSLFALGRELTKRHLGSVATAIFGALSGGIGYVLSRGVELDTEYLEAGKRFLGDLAVRRSYNSGFHNLAPTLPRDVTFALVPAFVLLVFLGIRERSRGLLVWAGVVGGVVGLTGAEAFFLCGAIALVLALILPERDKLATLLTVGIPMGLIWGVWLVPLLLNYRKLGGFDDTSAEPVHLPAGNILGAWGLVVPFALIGLFHAIRGSRRRSEAKVVVTVVGCAAGLLLFSQFAESFGAGFATLGRAHRYWPLMHLALAVAGGFGVVELLRTVWRGWNERGATVVGAALLVLCIPSPILGSLALPDDWGDPPQVVADTVAEEGTVVNAIDRRPGGESCVVASTDVLIQTTFWYTGYRLVRYRWTGLELGNLARVRWKNMRDFIPWDLERLRDNELLTQGSGTAAEWDQAAEKYGVDHVIATREEAAAGTYGDADQSAVDVYRLFSRSDCGQS